MRYVAAIDGWGSILCLYSCAAVGISAVIYCCIALQLGIFSGRSKVCVRSCTCAQVLLMSLMVLSLIIHFSSESYVSYEIHCSVSLMARDGSRNILDT